MCCGPRVYKRHISATGTAHTAHASSSGPHGKAKGHGMEEWAVAEER